MDKANPNLGVSVMPQLLESRVAMALAAPRAARDVKTKNFNIWQQSINRWITDDIWMQSALSRSMKRLWLRMHAWS
jgi:phage terminase large subunit-like protein